ncbi:hypothetical protein P8A21_21655 [Streptomyces poriferorum]|uniref:hypothetical protein n=1 Tax=Streptomyces poriferorum TaxID=2798799 RepID=UPI00273E7C3F|nr:hypothetical protein [Streptomyces sp. Alt1]WLQ49921.1 hypothetical protein P8A21_21655 [Streptomyces sp. Alt1]
MMTDSGVDDLSKYESGTDPFTAAELEAIARFRENLSAIPEIAFKGFEADEIRHLASENGVGEARNMLHTFATDLLNGWWLTVLSLKNDLPTCTDEPLRYSTAAARYVAHLTAQHLNACAKFERALTMWFLDLDTHLSSPLYLNRDGEE